ncbi:cell wall protein AWA1-like [Ixodes scapularis]|uniref:cell wall protein AWA1-like n=1 Tax=Ixodes scapularis TaxID=6945 RepID=UPI001A9EDC5A|nr:cell wall protein AWA1-like [Ixodes scapularis]
MHTAVICTLLFGLTAAQNFYLQQAMDGSLGQPFMQPSMLSFTAAESNSKPSFFRRPFFSGGGGGGSRPPGKSFFGIRTPSFLSGLKTSGSSPRPSFFSFARPQQNSFPQHIPLGQLEASGAHTTFHTIPLHGGMRLPFSAGAVLQQAPSHIAQATEYAESQADGDRSPNAFSGIHIFPQQGGSSFGSQNGEQDSYQQQVNSVVQLTPAASGSYGYKTDGSNVYNGIMTAQLGVPVSLTNFGDGPVSIPVGASGHGQQSDSSSDGQGYGHSSDSYSSSQGSGSQKAHQQDQPYSGYSSGYQGQSNSGSSYGSSSASLYNGGTTGTRYITAPSHSPNIGYYASQAGSGYGGSPTTFTLTSANGYAGSAASGYGGGSSGGYEPSMQTQGSNSNKYGPAYTLVGTTSYGGSSSGNYPNQQSSGYITAPASYAVPVSSSGYSGSSGSFTAPTRGYTSSQPSSGYTTTYTSGSPTKYTSTGSGYGSNYGSSSGQGASSSVAYDNSPASYDSQGSFGDRYPPSSGYGGPTSAAYTAKRPSTNYPSTTTSYKNSQSASAALAQALKAYANGNVKYVSTKPASSTTDTAYSSSYSSSGGSSGYSKDAAAPYFRTKGTPTYSKYTADSSLSFSDGGKTSSKTTSFDQRTVGQTLRVSGDGANSSDSYSTSTRSTNSPSKSSSTV